MTRLTAALDALGLTADIHLDGRWVRLSGARCSVYVAEGISEAAYYSWCECPDERAVEYYSDPVEALQAGLRRASVRRADSHSEHARRP